MAETGQEISTGRSRLALGLLLLIDGLTFVSLGKQDGQLTFGLSASGLPISLLVIDVLLSYGLFRASRWALELARYRCILGVCYLAFLWVSFFLVLDHQEAIVFAQVANAAATRDVLIGFTLTVILFLIREQKQPVVPKAPQTPASEQAPPEPPQEPSA